MEISRQVQKIKTKNVHLCSRKPKFSPSFTSISLKFTICWKSTWNIYFWLYKLKKKWHGSLFMYTVYFWLISLHNTYCSFCNAHLIYKFFIFTSQKPPETGAEKSSFPQGQPWAVQAPGRFRSTQEKKFLEAPLLEVTLECCSLMSLMESLSWRRE